jgi:hypothetical protein
MGVRLLRGYYLLRLPRTSLVIGTIGVRLAAALRLGRAASFRPFTFSDAGGNENGDLETARQRDPDKALAITISAVRQNPQVLQRRYGA